MNKLVSIIIPFYNDGDYLGQAIQSILDQTYTHKEIIVVDDGSDQKNKTILKKLKPKIDLLITQDNAGPSVARNKGIGAAKGDYILPLDADDYFQPTFIQRAVEILNNYPRVGLVTCHAHIFNEKGIFDEIISRGGEAKELLKKNGALANSMFRKDTWRSVEGYDEDMLKGYEDWDFNISIVKAGWEIFVINEYLFHYRQKESSRNEIANSSHKYELLAFIYRKHKDIFINNYEENINHFFARMARLEKEKIKITKTSTYKLGSLMLRPLKILKNKWDKFILY